MKGIADTGFIVAFGNRNDTHHRWASEVAKMVTDPLLTCESVIAEAAFHLQSVAYVLSLVDAGLLSLSFSAMEHLDYLAQLAEKYEGRRPDFADLCLIRMSELYPKHTVITTDEKDFSVYRRNKKEAIPLLTPRFVGPRRKR